MLVIDIQTKTLNGNKRVFIGTKRVTTIQYCYTRLYRKVLLWETSKRWDTLLHELSCKIERFLSRRNISNCYASYVRSNGGSLDLCLSRADPYLLILIKECSYKCSSICETCGKKATIVGDNFNKKALCKKCFKKEFHVQKL